MIFARICFICRGIGAASCSLLTEHLAHNEQLLPLSGDLWLLHLLSPFAGDLPGNADAWSGGGFVIPPCREGGRTPKPPNKQPSCQWLRADNNSGGLLRIIPLQEAAFDQKLAPF